MHCMYEGLSHLLAIADSEYYVHIYGILQKDRSEENSNWLYCCVHITVEQDLAYSSDCYENKV